MNISLLNPIYSQIQELSPNGSKKWALLMGINDYKNLPPPSWPPISKFTDLSGPINDVNLFKDLLIHTFNFPPENITLLLNEQVIKRNILNCFEEIATKSHVGDLIVFYFSGHGSQIPDLNGDEEDGFDEVLCLWDVNPDTGENILLDDELGVLLRKYNNKEVVVIIDSCHSGTCTRNIVSTGWWRDKYLPIKATSPSIISRSFPVTDDKPSDYIFLSAASDYQKALEIAIKEDSKLDFYGGLTYCLSQTLSKHNDIEYIELYNDIKKQMKDIYMLPHDPQIQPIGSKKLEQKVFTTLRPSITVTQIEPTLVKPSPTPIIPPIKITPTPPSTLPMKTPAPTTVHLTTPTPFISPSPTSVIKPKPTPAYILASPMPIQKPSPPEEEKLLISLTNFTGANNTLMDSIREKLSKKSYIKLVGEKEFYDRLVEGEIKEGKYYARIINRIGDVTNLTHTSSLDELIKSIEASLDYAYVAKQLVYLTPDQPAFKVKVWINDEWKRDFYIGEEIKFNVWAEEDCYLLLLNFFGDGNFKVIFPNEYYKDNYIKGNLTYQIPNEEMSKEGGFIFRFSPPTGEEIVKAIASKTKLEPTSISLEQFRGGFPVVVPPEKDAPSPLLKLVKDITICLQKPGLQWSTDSITIRSHEKK